MKAIVTLLFVLFVTTVSYSMDMVHLLGYHSFINGKRSQYDFSLGELRNQIGYFKNRGYRFVSFSDIVNGRIHGSKNILITIDDGNRSVYRAYQEILKPLNIKPLLAVYLSVIGKRSALSWKQLDELASDGCEIAAHGFYHRKMSPRLYREHKKSYLNEIYKPRAILEKKLKKKIRVFVYPYGLYTDDAFEHLRRAGYEYALTVRDGSLTLPFSSLENPYEIPRYVITRPDKKFAFSRIIRYAEKEYRITSGGKKRRGFRSDRDDSVIRKKRILVSRDAGVHADRGKRISASGPGLRRIPSPKGGRDISMLAERNSNSENKKIAKSPRAQNRSWVMGKKIFSYNINDGLGLNWWQYRKKGKIQYRVTSGNYHLSKKAVKSNPDSYSRLTAKKRYGRSSKDYELPVDYKAIKKKLDKVTVKGDRVRESGNHLMKSSVRKYHAIFDMMREKIADYIR
jgi:peptidoglycan/xylan/chitin deacetylase (PgdA/CDA1 family)